MNVSRRRAQEAAARTRALVIGIVVAVVAALAVVLALSLGPSEDAAEYQPALVQGAALPPLGDGDPLGLADAAVGLDAPVVEGFDLDGERLTIAPDGRPLVVVLLAHWCPHCQREVPVLVDWLAGLDPATAPRVVGVATAIDETAPNYPPEAWLERESWPAEVAYDPETAVPPALGSSGYPFFVVVAPDGTVARRLSGEIDVAVLDEVLADLG